MAVFSATKTFHNGGGELGLAPMAAANHPLLVSVFLGVSALLLVAFGLFRRNVASFFGSRRSVAVAGVLGLAGTMLLQLGGGASVLGVVIAGTCMGVCASLFVILLGNAFARFEFATCVLDSAVSVALGFVCAVAFVNWIPSPVSGVISACMPVLMTVAFWRKTHSQPGSSDSGIEGGYLRAYFVRFAASMLLFGVVMGALRVVCADNLLSSGGITIELVMGVACVVSVLLFVFAYAASRRETLWDSLFRTVSPMVFLGVASIAALLGELELVAAFFVALGFVCLATLLWIFLASLARNLNGASIFVFGVGYGLMQATSILGCLLANAFMGSQAFDATAFVSLLGGTEVVLVESGPLHTLANFAVLALVLCVVLSFACALYPRYREMRGIFSSVLGELLRNRKAPGEDEAEAAGAMEAAGGAGVASGTGATGAAEAPEAPGSAVAAVGADGGTEGIAAGRGLSAGAEAALEAPLEDERPTPSEAEQPEPSEQPEQPQREDKGSFVRRCEELSATYGLSAREKEVFFLLAKGHNAAYITDKLCVSRSTVKTHINHIYKKMDIHTQQELLTMVEDRARGPLGAEIDRDAIREALESNPSEIVEHIHRDYIGF